jgi:hypothetical protein
MKRREMIKRASALAITPLIFPGSFTGSPENQDFVPLAEKVKRFGDERDWFFEKRYGMFVHWGLYSYRDGMSSISGGQGYRELSTLNLPVSGIR